MQKLADDSERVTRVAAAEKAAATAHTRVGVYAAAAVSLSTAPVPTPFTVPVHIQFSVELAAIAPATANTTAAAATFEKSIFQGTCYPPALRMAAKLLRSSNTRALSSQLWEMVSDQPPKPAAFSYSTTGSASPPALGSPDPHPALRSAFAGETL